MSQGFEGSSRRHREGVFSAVSAGVFFILVGLIFVTRPELFDRISDFFQDFSLVRVPNTEILFPGPQHPGGHLIVYRAVEQFSFFWALFQIIMLPFRFAARSPLGKKAETVSNFVFWIGVYFLIGRLFIRTTTLITLTTWFSFWSLIIMLAGVSLIVRAILLATAAAVRMA